jgi:hypothetical protein
MSFIRLESLSPSTASLFRNAVPDARQRAAVLACTESIAASGIASAAVVEALLALRSGETPLPHCLLELTGIVEELDRQYLDLEATADSGQREEALRLFSQARSVSALLFALTSEPHRLHEVIYEALSSLDDPTHLIEATEDVLRGETS